MMNASESKSDINNQSSKPVPSSNSHETIPARDQEVCIPADGDSLYQSIMVGYLFPVVNDADLFNKRLAMLIREDTIISTSATKDDKKDDDNKDDSKDDSKIEIHQVWDAGKVRQNFLTLFESCIKENDGSEKLYEQFLIGSMMPKIWMKREENNMNFWANFS